MTNDKINLDYFNLSVGEFIFLYGHDHLSEQHALFQKALLAYAAKKDDDKSLDFVC